MTAGQVSDYKGAALLVETLHKAKALLGDRGYDANWFRKAQIDYDKDLYKQRHKVENMFAKLKDWRRVTSDMTDAHTPSSLPSLSQLPSPSGFNL